MALNDMLTLIAVIFTFAGLLVNIVNTTFNITWKIAHEHKDEDSKKKRMTAFMFPNLNGQFAFLRFLIHQ